MANNNNNNNCSSRGGGGAEAAPEKGIENARNGVIQQILPMITTNRLMSAAANMHARAGAVRGGGEEDQEQENEQEEGGLDNDGGEQPSQPSTHQQRQNSRKDGASSRRRRRAASSSSAGGGGNELMQLVTADLVSRFAPVVGAAVAKGAVALGRRVLLRRRGGNALYDNIVRYAGQVHEKSGSVFLTSTGGQADGSTSASTRGGGSGRAAEAGSADMFEAVLALATDLPDAQVIHHDAGNGGRFIVESDRVIPLGNEVYFRRVSSTEAGMSGGGSGTGNGSGGGGGNGVPPMTIEVFSFVKDVVQLRSFLADLELHFRSAKNNQLGRQLYYFDEMVAVPPVSLSPGVGADSNNNAPRVDLTRMPSHPTFSMSALHTTKTLHNVFGRCMHTVRQRVDFFLHNRDWYQRKGVPYTLGFLMHGSPGCGKTSFIKGLAKHAGRHIVNVRLSKYTTSAQLAHLLHSGVIHAVHNGRSSSFEIPIDRVLLVMEDIDCLSDVVLDRRRHRNGGRGAGGGGGGKGGATTTRRTREEEAQLLRRPDVGYRLQRMMEALKQKNSMEAFAIAVELDACRKVAIREGADGGGDAGGAKAAGAGDDPSDALRLNLSVLLNLLDGVLETPGRMLVMTSNFPERLDRALIRPGRIDCIIHFSRCAPADIAEIIEAMLETRLRAEDVDGLPADVWTPAQVSQAVFERLNEPDPLVSTLAYLRDPENARCVFDAPSDDDDNDNDNRHDDDGSDSEGKKKEQQKRQTAVTNDGHKNESDEEGEEDEEERASTPLSADAHADGVLVHVRQPPGQQQNDGIPHTTASSMGRPSAPAPDAAASPSPASAMRSNECSFLDAPRTDADDVCHVFSRDDSIYAAIR